MPERTLPAEPVRAQKKTPAELERGGPPEPAGRLTRPPEHREDEEREMEDDRTGRRPFALVRAYAALNDALADGRRLPPDTAEDAAVAAAMAMDAAPAADGGEPPETAEIALRVSEQTRGELAALADRCGGTENETAGEILETAVRLAAGLTTAAMVRRMFADGVAAERRECSERLAARAGPAVPPGSADRPAAAPGGAPDAAAGPNPDEVSGPEKPDAVGRIERDMNRAMRALVGSGSAETTVPGLRRRLSAARRICRRLDDGTALETPGSAAPTPPLSPAELPRKDQNAGSRDRTLPDEGGAGAGRFGRRRAVSEPAPTSGRGRVAVRPRAEGRPRRTASEDTRGPRRHDRGPGPSRRRRRAVGADRRGPHPAPAEGPRRRLAGRPAGGPVARSIRRT